MIVRDRDIVLDARMVRGVIEEFEKDVRPRLKKLGDAYANKGPIATRMRASGLPNNRLAHAFPRYIVAMASGYLIGKPVTYRDEKQTEAVEALNELYKQGNMDSVDAELAAEASIYGKAVCICYADEDGRPKAATLSPMCAFVVYDDTVEHKPLFGVHWLDKVDARGKTTGVTVNVYDEAGVTTYTGKTLAALSGEPTAMAAHYFGGVPMVEFWNNAQETGDFEPVLSLIEAYDVLESDRVNDKQQFTDALLLLTGCTLENDDPDDPRSPAQRLLEEKTLSLPDGDAKAEWLVKASDESGAETLKNALKTDIHKMSMVPDMTDESFAANASGVAMRYKLLGLEQLTGIKERWFREGLRSRLRLYANFMNVLAMGTLDADAVTMTFTRSLPVNETEISAMVAQLDGLVPQQILLSQLPFVEDVDEAMAQLEQQRAKDARRNAEAFGGRYLDGNEQDTDDDGQDDAE